MIERAEQKAVYGKRMQKMYRRLGKYALDPDNKTKYLNRADQWAKYTEKWQSYHEKQLAKAVKSEIIYESLITGKSLVHGFDVTNEYASKATPGKGSISHSIKYNESSHKDEVAFASWLYDNYGGEIRLLIEKNKENVKTSDYLWNGKRWELKSVTTEKAADSAVRKALKQISKNLGGIILNYGDNEISYDILKSIIEKRLSRHLDFDVDIMIVGKGKIIRILRYKKMRHPPAK